MKRALKILICVILFSSYSVPQSINELKIGSKKFTENVLLGELALQLISTKTKAVHIRELGGTRILWNALLNGELDIYPEYTGTILKEIIASENLSVDNLEMKLNELNIGMTKPIGFNNTYAIGMKKKLADSLGIKSISDLQNYPDLTFGFTNEFLDRKDGWPGLKQTYKLPQTKVTGLDHDLAYRGLDAGSIDVIDLYSTDAEIDYYDLNVLDDDLNYFIEYKAVYLYRIELKKYPDIIRELNRLENSINESEMIRMNSDVKLNGRTESEVAADFIQNNFSIKTFYKENTFIDRLLHNTKEHLFLVLFSLSAAILIAIPLGIASFKNKKTGKIILGLTGIIQTIPSLALLVFMIPLLGIGSWPAICALFLYSLLPIVRNTFSGLDNIPTSIKESAIVLGLSSFTILRKVELPIASRSILAGIKTSAVINVGTATLGALIGAGGYGQPILTGIRLDNVSLILEGAVPAAMLALLVQWMFDLFEKMLIPRGLRI